MSETTVLFLILVAVIAAIVWAVFCASLMWLISHVPPVARTVADAVRRALEHLVDWVLLLATVAALSRPAAAAAPVSATPRHSHRRGGA